MNAEDLERLLAACADEPIATPDAVQAPAAALAVHGSRVVVASANTGVVLDAEADERILGADPSELLDEVVGAAVTQAAAATPGTTRLLPAHRFGAGPVDIELHTGADGLVLVELEPVDDDRLVSAAELAAHQQALCRADSREELLALAAVEIRSLTGFDRVMVYRFDEQWNGEVIAESRRDDLEPFLGLRYPASDIPEQARALYRRNLLRLIADVDAPVVPLVYDDGFAARPIDLAPAAARAVSPVHLQYLRNMGVTASMSLSLLEDGELWGLIACHGYGRPHRPSRTVRAAALALTELTAALRRAKDEAGAAAERVAAGVVLRRLLARLDEEDDLGVMLTSPPARDDLLELVGAGGVAVNIDGRVHVAGEVPPSATVATTVEALLGGRSGGALATDALAWDDAADVAQAAGALVVPVVGSPRRWLVWFRPELVQEVRWGGDPTTNEIAVDADGTPRLTPRRSFAEYVQVVAGHSRPWVGRDTVMADALAEQVTAAVARRSRRHVETIAEIQRAVLTETTVAVPGLDVAVRYDPAGDGALGGDWHDVFFLGDGCAAIVVGDVAGHGAEVAGIMGQLRNALRAYLVDTSSAEVAVQRLNLLMSRLLRGHLATLVVVVVDPASGHYRTVSAGHPPGLVVGTGEGRFLPGPSGPALGIVEDIAFTPHEDELAPGERLLLFTDGLFERRREVISAGLERLRATAVAVDADAAGLVEALVAVRPSDDDDCTVVALGR